MAAFASAFVATFKPRFWTNLTINRQKLWACSLFCWYRHLTAAIEWPCAQNIQHSDARLCNRTRPTAPAQNQPTRELTSARKTSHKHSNKDLSRLRLLWHSSKYKAHKLHQRYTLTSRTLILNLVISRNIIADLKNKKYKVINSIAENVGNNIEICHSTAFWKLICIRRSISHTSESEVTWLATHLEKDVEAIGERWRGYSLNFLHVEMEWTEWKSHLSDILCVCSVNRSSVAITSVSHVSGDSTVVWAPNSWLKSRRFKSPQERR